MMKNKIGNENRLRPGMMVTLLATLTGAALLAGSAQTARADVVFTEPFATHAANWRIDSGGTMATWASTGGPAGAGDAYITRTTPVSGSTIMFRGQDSFDASGDGFVRNWIAAGVRTFSIDVLQDSGSNMNFTLRFAKSANFPGASTAAFTVPSGVWTNITIPILNSTNVFQTYEGSDFATIFSGIGNVQFSVTALPATPVNLSIDNPTIRNSIFAVTNTSPALELYMYGGAFSTNAARIPVWAYNDEESGVDTRMSQSIVGWQTASLVPTNQSPTHYLVKRCLVTLTINDNNTFIFDPTHDPLQNFLDTNNPAYQPDSDTGLPVEMFGVGYRNGYNVATFSQAPAFGSGAPGSRNAYAAGWGTNGIFVDVSNNFGKTNNELPTFEAWPFAVGQVTNVAPGQPVPATSKMFFDLNVADPAVMTYLQGSLNGGVLNFSVSALHPVFGMGGPLTYPSFTTHYNGLAPTPTKVEFEGTIISNVDNDGDGLPDDWELFYFGNLDQGAGGDPDGDGAGNLAEYQNGTNPTLANSAFYVKLTDTGALNWPNLPSRQSVVQSSTDLLNWQTVSNVPVVYPTPSAATWTDTNAASSQLFYRVQAGTP